MKKVCQCCGRNRRIGRFGKCSAKPDGKNIYCRECMRKFTKGYRCTFEGRKSQYDSNKRWKERNKNNIKEYNKIYYKNNRSKILYNKKAREETESVLIFENSKKNSNSKINKVSESCIIEINPKRKQKTTWQT